MTGKTQLTRFGVVLALVFVSTQAMAWGPRAQRTITGMAIQVIQHQYPDTFNPGDASYEQDVLRGAEAGVPIIAQALPINSEAEAIQAVGIQIQMLRDLRSRGAGSYFAYRMGVLSALISDILLPYGLVWNEEDQAIQRKIESDINDHLTEFAYISSSAVRTPIIDVEQHFRSQLAFYSDNRLLIADDYKRGRGYAGLLKSSGDSYFAKAVESTADAWYTIVKPDTGSLHASSVTNSLLEQYYVNEIEYLLTEKSNFHQAGKVYENLAALNSSDPGIYELVADHYYAFGTRESIERSVKEWRTAYSIGGPNRDRVSAKLSAHFLKEGEKFLEEATEKGKGEVELPAALAAFQQALRYDRTSDIAADQIQETNRLKKEREERREMIINIIASAESTKETADNHAISGNFGNAFGSYSQAREFLGAVDDEFTDQYTLAEEMRTSIESSIAKTIADVQEQATNAIEEGERLEDANKYDDAILMYEKVPVIVQVIPEDHTKMTKQDKQDRIDTAAAKIEEARRNKERYEQAKKAPGGTARMAPGAAPAAAPAAPRAAPAPAPAEDDEDDDRGRRRRRRE